MKLSEMLYESRLHSGKTQLEVCKSMKMSNITYNLLENGRYNTYKALRPKTVWKLGKYLNVSPEVILKAYKEEYGNSSISTR